MYFTASAEDQIIHASRDVANVDPNEPKCKFGDHELHIGDQVSDKDKRMECKCITPPHVECHLKYPELSLF